MSTRARVQEKEREPCSFHRAVSASWRGMRKRRRTPARSDGGRWSFSRPPDTLEKEPMKGKTEEAKTPAL